MSADKSMTILDADERHANFTMDTDLRTGSTEITIGPDVDPERLAATLRLLCDHFTPKGEHFA